MKPFWCHGLFCRNEVDILADTIEFHRRRGAVVCVIDNGSDDGGWELCQELHAAGEIAFLHQISTRFNDCLFRNALAFRMHDMFRPRWLSIGDCDEMWHIDSDELGDCRADVLSLPVRHWWPTDPNQRPGEMSVSSSTGDLFFWRVGRKTRKTIVRPSGLWAFSVGGHSASVIGETARAQRSFVGHYPHRGFPQILARVARWQEVNVWCPRLLSRTSRRLVAIADQGLLTEEWYRRQCASLKSRRYQTASEFYLKLQQPKGGGQND